MRVVAGTARGHKLTAPEGLDARPTADKIKEAVFSMISNHVYGSDFLDLYSGTGAMGIEALSRGCGFCAMMEILPAHCDIIKKNLSHVDKALAHQNYLVLNKNAADAQAYGSLKENKFDIVYMDPPYGKNLVAQTLAVLHTADILKPHSIVIAEQGINETPPEAVGFYTVKQKKYGKTSVYFLKTMEEC